jgi:hypothetical protein
MVNPMTTYARGKPGKPSLSQAELMALFHYDPETGVMRHLVGKWAGQDAGCVSSQGYVQISIAYKKFRRARLAWLYMTGEWPEDLVDHINGIRDDDRFCNIRPATRAQNKYNSRGRRNGRLKGTTWSKRNGRWQATIQVKMKTLHLGYYDSELEAHQAYGKAAIASDTTAALRESNTQGIQK